MAFSGLFIVGQPNFLLRFGVGGDWVPGHRVHRYVDRMLYGRSYWKIHVKMDLPYLVLGSTHRVLFHDPATAAFIAESCYPNDPNAVQAALGHIYLDRLCSNNPNLKVWLELLANKDAQDRAKTRKTRKNRKKKRRVAGVKYRKRRRTQQNDPFEEFEEFYKKVKQLQNLAKELSK